MRRKRRLLRAVLDEQLLEPIDAAWPLLRIGFDDDRQAGRAYYTEVCFGVDADAEERLLISGVGSERVLHLRDAR